MKRTVIGALIAVTLASVVVKAQTTLYSQSGAVFAYLDSPGPSAGQNVSAASFHLDGWSFDTNSGGVPQYVTLYRDNGNNTLTNVPITTYVVSRPDVAAAYSPYYPNVWDGVGFMVYPNSPEPTGYWQYYLFFSDGVTSVMVAQEVNLTY